MKFKPDINVSSSMVTRLGYKVRYEDGYTSWSPKEIFERANRKMTPKEVEMVLVGGG